MSIPRNLVLTNYNPTDRAHAGWMPAISQKTSWRTIPDSCSSLFCSSSRTRVCGRFLGARGSKVVSVWRAFFGVIGRGRALFVFRSLWLFFVLHPIPIMTHQRFTRNAVVNSVVQTGSVFLATRKNKKLKQICKKAADVLADFLIVENLFFWLQKKR